MRTIHVSECESVLFPISGENDYRSTYQMRMLPIPRHNSSPLPV